MDYAAEYERLHSNAKYFQGFSLKTYVSQIADLVERFEPVRLLDYGCGKGHQYLVSRLHEGWGGLLPHCYDIGVRGLSAKPEGRFDGVICTDMMEHIEAADVPGVLDDIFASCEPKGFVFFAIACRPAHPKRTLSDGRNLHVTVRQPEWWITQIEQAVERVGLVDITVDTEFDEREEA